MAVKWTPVGEFRTPIQIQVRNDVRDSFGGVGSSWTTIFSCRAKVENLTGQLLYQTGEFVQHATYKITARFPIDKNKVVGPNDRIVAVDNKETRTFEIQSILNPGERSREIVFLCYRINPTE